MIMRDFGASIYAVFIWPGDFLLSQLAQQLPALALVLGMGDGDHSALLRAVVAWLCWFLVSVVVRAALRLARNIARILGATIRTLSFRVSLAARKFKTWIVCKIRTLLPQRRSATDDCAPEVKFDALDIAVLQSAAACGPGFTTSAPELAEHFTTRPAQIQRSLDKLRKSALLENVIGSTDGFDNYRLSLSGTAFMTMLERRQGHK